MHRHVSIYYYDVKVTMTLLSCVRFEKKAAHTNTHNTITFDAHTHTPNRKLNGKNEEITYLYFVCYNDEKTEHSSEIYTQHILHV